MSKLDDVVAYVIPVPVLHVVQSQPAIDIEGAFGVAQ
jgi:hypothetical protein